MRATVIGAGVAGLTCALELAERGVAVEVFERSDSLGMPKPGVMASGVATPAATSCSWHAGGMLAPWCERESAEPLVAQLGRESIEWWSAKFPGTVRRGTLVLAHGRDVGELHAFARKTEQYEWVDGERIAALEPDLAERFQRGLYFASEAHLDPRAALSALAVRLAERGVPIHFGAEAQVPSAASESDACATLAAADGRGRDVRRAADLRSVGEAACPVGVPRSTPDHVVIDCRGLAARDVLTDLRGVKGEMLLLRQPELSLSRPVRILHPRVPIYIVPRGDGVFMAGATMIESDEPRRVTARAVLELLSAAYALHPAFGEAEIVEIGTGVRAAFPDNLPCVRWRNGVLHVNGFYRHGFLLAPALARQAAAEVMGENHPQRRFA